MAGTVTVTPGAIALAHRRREPDLQVINIAWVGDAGDGSVPATTLEKVRGMLVRLVTNPGTPAPTDDYDITLVDRDGLDVLDGAGANRDTANSEEEPISMTGGIPRVLDGEDLTLNISGNTQAGAQGVIRLFVI